MMQMMMMMYRSIARNARNKSSSNNIVVWNLSRISSSSSSQTSSKVVATKNESTSSPISARKYLTTHININTNTNTNTNEEEPMTIIIKPKEKEEERRQRKNAYIETYGCQMNTSDSEVVASVLSNAGYLILSKEDIDIADLILVNTCAIREKAEERVFNRLRQIQSSKMERKNKVIGVLGCMGERIKGELLNVDEKSGKILCDIVAGPDAYRDLPRLIENAMKLKEEKKSKKIEEENNHSKKRFEPKITDTMNVELSLTETYSDVFPMRRGLVEDMSTSAFVTVQRGCDNMCAFCIVPFTRGRERSRDSRSIIEEVKKRFYEEDVREIVLLGQNVNSYSDKSFVESNNDSSSDINSNSETRRAEGVYAEGFKSVYVPSRNRNYDFARLMKDVCAISPELRVRFTSPHPKDFPDSLLKVISETPNASKLLHMPAQSGSTTCLERMNRGYTREAYLNLIEKAQDIIGHEEVFFSSDFISGFCEETEQEHLETISLLKIVKYEQAFTFAYSLRDKTQASRKFEDSVPEDIKQRRLAEVIETFRMEAGEKAKREIGKSHLVLIEGRSKRDDLKATGRADNGKRVVFSDKGRKRKKGEYVEVFIREAGINTLVGDLIRTTTAKAFYEANGGKAWY